MVGEPDAGYRGDEAGYPPASILVVDDVPANRLAIEALLTTLGHRIVTAPSGAVALERAAAEEFAVILMDVHMPGLDGFETVAALRGQGLSRRTPIVFMSAVHDAPEHQRRAYELGAVDYIAKPLSPEILSAKLANLVSLYRQRNELERRAEVIREKSADAERAKEAAALRDRYIGVLGHELRNPLSVISLNATRLTRVADLAIARELGESINHAVARADAIIRDVLDFTRGQLGSRMPVVRASGDLGDATRSVVHELSMLHPDRQIHFEPHGDLKGSWDIDRVEQALGNLVTNALKHGIGTVSIVAEGRQEQVVLAVHNFGPVIPPEMMGSLFEPFRRGNRSADGLGLGLYVVREIVRAHGGDVEVRSCLKEGTTFVSHWPRL